MAFIDEDRLAYGHWDHVFMYVAMDLDPQPTSNSEIEIIKKCVEKFGGYDIVYKELKDYLKFDPRKKDPKHIFRPHVLFAIETRSDFDNRLDDLKTKLAVIEEKYKTVMEYNM